MFVDITEAFATVPRELLWETHTKYGVPPKFLKMLHFFHSTMKANVCIGIQELTSPSESLGVEGRCIQSLYLNCHYHNETKKKQKKNSINDRVHIEYGLDGSLFNIRRVQERTKNTTEQLKDHPYADNATNSGRFHQHLPRPGTTS